MVARSLVSLLFRRHFSHNCQAVPTTSRVSVQERFHQPLPSLKRIMNMKRPENCEWAEGWKDRTTDMNDLKETFSRVRADSPVPNDVKYRAHFLCAQYLGGSWKTIDTNDFSLTQITGGMSNLLFLVQLHDSVKKTQNEPSQALLRIHCQSDIDQLLTESVVFTLLSERNLGPRLLGVFPGGRFEEFIPSRPLQCLEISEESCISKIAPMLARVHSLEVPIGKEPQVINRARSWLEKWSKYEIASRGVDMICTRATVDAHLFPSTLSVADLSAELDFVQSFLQCINSPVVFSHNDLQEGNILLVDPSAVISDDLAVIDFEYCDYNPRGFDLGNHLCEYGLDYACDEEPFYKIYMDKLNVADKRRLFCEKYHQELVQLSKSGIRIPCDLLSRDYSCDISRLETEASLFMAVSHIFWSCWALLNAEESSISFGYAEYARDRLALYFEKKPLLEEFIEKNTQH